MQPHAIAGDEVAVSGTGGTCQRGEYHQDGKEKMSHEAVMPAGDVLLSTGVPQWPSASGSLAAWARSGKSRKPAAIKSDTSDKPATTPNAS